MLLADGLGSVKDASSNRGFCMKARASRASVNMSDDEMMTIFFDLLLVILGTHRPKLWSKHQSKFTKRALADENNGLICILDYNI